MAGSGGKIPPQVASHWEAVESQWGGDGEAAADRGDDTALQRLFRSAVALVHRLKIVAEELHHQGELSASRRGVLMGLHRHGPQTVPEMARRRPVSRQHIQALVNPLVDEGYVELVDNPAHKRSRRVRLTAKGEAFVAEIEAREARVLGALTLGCTEEELRSATSVLIAARQAFEGEQWQRHVAQEEKQT